MGTKLHPIKAHGEHNEEFLFYCPGCGCSHWVRISGVSPVWAWNKDMEKPTFEPSLMVNRGTDRQCHSFIRNGRIQYLSDSWHDLRGKTVDMEDWDNQW